MSDISQYKGLVPEDPNKLGPGTMSTEEFIRWQGENGEIYRGLAEPDPGRLGPGTMSTEEFIRWQGENGEIYRGMQPTDPDEYRLSTTGTSDVELAKLVDDFIRAASLTPEGVRQLVTNLSQEPNAINMLIEKRYRKTSDFLYSWGDWNKERISTDLQIIANLMKSGYDFSTFQINPSNMMGANELVDFIGFLDHYINGLEDKISKGKNVTILNPLDPEHVIKANDLLKQIKEYYIKLQEAKAQAEVVQDQESGPTL